MPSYSETPVFSFPAHKWVQRLDVIFKASKIDLTDDATAKRYTPILLSRLPNEIFDLIDPTYVIFWSLFQSTTSL